MFIRFETNLLHPDNGKPSGILQAIHYLEQERIIERWQDEVFDEVRDILMDLDKPDVIDDYDSRRLIAWFKPEAKRFIDACHRLVSIFEMHQLVVYIRRERTLSDIKYEDEFQVLQLDRKHL